MVERLYYTDCFLHDFQARVVEVLQNGGRSAVTLDRTAFYPTGGGQVFDTGTLASQSRELAHVVAVVEREDGEILHLLESQPAWLESGVTVQGGIDAERRRDHMQQHSGQHVLSAAFVRLFNMPTVSFHMGEVSCTIDLETRALSADQLSRAAGLANQVIGQDRPVEIRFAAAEEARALGVRKMPEHKGKLRLIEIRDFDLTACGGTHVRSTAQVGAILLRRTENVKPGVRVEFICGQRAVATSQRDYSALTEAAAAFSAHIWDLPQKVRKAQEELKAAAKAQQKLFAELVELYAARLLAEAPEVRSIRVVTRVIADRDVAFAKLLAQKIAAAVPNSVALIASTAAAPTLIFAQSPGLPHDMGALMKQAMRSLSGRGGGSKDFAQGSVPDASRIEPLLKEIVKKIRT